MWMVLRLVSSWCEELHSKSEAFSPAGGNVRLGVSEHTWQVFHYIRTMVCPSEPSSRRSYFEYVQTHWNSKSVKTSKRLISDCSYIHESKTMNTLTMSYSFATLPAMFDTWNKKKSLASKAYSLTLFYSFKVIFLCPCFVLLEPLSGIIYWFQPIRSINKHLLIADVWSFISMVPYFSHFQITIFHARPLWSSLAISLIQRNL